MMKLHYVQNNEYSPTGQSQIVGNSKDSSPTIAVPKVLPARLSWETSQESDGEGTNTELRTDIRMSWKQIQQGQNSVVSKYLHKSITICILVHCHPSLSLFNIRKIMTQVSYIFRMTNYNFATSEENRCLPVDPPTGQSHSNLHHAKVLHVSIFSREPLNPFHCITWIMEKLSNVASGTLFCYWLCQSKRINLIMICP